MLTQGNVRPGNLLLQFSVVQSSNSFNLHLHICTPWEFIPGCRDLHLKVWRENDALLQVPTVQPSKVWGTLKSLACPSRFSYFLTSYMVSGEDRLPPQGKLFSPSFHFHRKEVSVKISFPHTACHRVQTHQSPFRLYFVFHSGCQEHYRLWVT